MIQTHEMSIKPFSPRLKDLWDDFVQPKPISAIFQSPEDDLPAPGQFRLTTRRDRLSPEDDFRQLVSSNPLFRFTKMTFWHHQIAEDDSPGPGRFRLVVSQNWLGPGKSSSVILLFPVSHLPQFRRSQQVIFRNSWAGRNASLPILSFSCYSVILIWLVLLCNTHCIMQCYYAKSFLFPLSINSFFMQ